MIIQLSEETCATRGCNQKLLNGQNTGGWVGKRTHEGNYTSGYTCKKCGNQSIPTTQRLALFQQTTNFAKVPQSYHNITNKTIKHKRQWNKLTKTNDTLPTNNKMPNWNDVLDGMKKKRKKKEAKD